MNQRTLLSIFFLVLFIQLMPSNLLGQQSTEIESYHQVILKSRPFDAIELADLQTRLSNDGPFTIHENCKELGLLVIRIPVAASLRVHTIEEIVVAATHEILNHEASVIQNKTPLEVANCSN
jgi:hypothetical protein